MNNDEDKFSENNVKEAIDIIDSQLSYLKKICDISNVEYQKLNNEDKKILEELSTSLNNYRNSIYSRFEYNELKDEVEIKENYIDEKKLKAKEYEYEKYNNINKYNKKEICADQIIYDIKENSIYEDENIYDIKEKSTYEDEIMYDNEKKNIYEDNKNNEVCNSKDRYFNYVNNYYEDKENNSIHKQMKRYNQNQNSENDQLRYYKDFGNKLTGIIEDNNTLLVSEKKGKVFLPYKVAELEAYLDEYPDDYNSLSDVINQEYIIPISKYRSPIISRFKEMYSLMRDVEMKSVLDSVKKAVGIMFNSKINPYIISACKSEEQFEKYKYYMERGRLNEFNEFKIIFEIFPLHMK